MRWIATTLPLQVRERFPKRLQQRRDFRAWIHQQVARSLRAMAQTLVERMVLLAMPRLQHRHERGMKFIGRRESGRWRQIEDRHDTGRIEPAREFVLGPKSRNVEAIGNPALI